ncbi:tripartite tricarboxylate transporter TctB family protein [Halobellus salinisoli]|uniref:tripartite tricarboxylate transporter TctB family protein n=1 Tax=Halobellus salinisoli TaxID=3108500 RepID=UPI00300B6A0B
MGVFALYTFIDSYNHGWEAAIFPRFASAVVLVGCILILLKAYLPYPLNLLFSEGGDFLSTDEMESTESEDSAMDKPEETGPENPVYVMMGLVTAFAVLGYLFGLLWVAPLFVLVFGRYFDLPTAITVVLIALSMVVVLGFQWIFNIQMGEGLLFEPEFLMVSGGING